MKTISISVAAYNVEAFIRQCLDSFVDSGVLEDVEVIVTDDGSKDSTPQIVKEYEEKYPGCIRLISQPNAGPGSTVNSGICHATGKYFRMVDGDDWVCPAEFAKLVRELKQLDVDAVVCDYVMVDHKTGQEEPHLLHGIPVAKVMPFSEMAPQLKITMHNFIVKTEIMKQHVTLDNCFYTDMQYLLFPVAYIKDIVFFDFRVYMYRVALGTQSMNPKSLQKNIAMHERVFASLLDYYDRYSSSPDYDPVIAEYLSHRIVGMAGCQLHTYLSFDPSKERRQRIYDFFDEIKSRSPEIYRVAMTMKTARALKLGKVFYYPVSAYIRRRMGL